LCGVTNTSYTRLRHAPGRNSALSPTTVGQVEADALLQAMRPTVRMSGELVDQTLPLLSGIPAALK